MSYELLLSLYYGSGTNADLTTQEARDLLHVRTSLDERITATLREGVSVILTGNPGDGKSHLARRLLERGELEGASVLLDVSALSAEAALAAWSGHRRAGRRFLFCANEGPLTELLAAAEQVEELRPDAHELRSQLGCLTAVDPASLPPRPARVMLIDLADRSHLDIPLIEAALARVSNERFLPDLRGLEMDSSSGRNLDALQYPEVRRRLARVLSIAGRRRGEHVTFRQLWSAISLAITGNRTPTQLRAEVNVETGPAGRTLLDNLLSTTGRGALVEATRSFGDVGRVPAADLEESLWQTAEPPGGTWFVDPPHLERPQSFWDRGDREGALLQLRRLKHVVALGHSQGEVLVAGLERGSALPSGRDDRTLKRQILTGLRRLYLAGPEESGAPGWLQDGVPLWVSLTYGDTEPEQRPHVATRAMGDEQFELLRPVRVPWLADALGSSPERAWLRHIESGVVLRVDPELLGALDQAAGTSGPMRVPEPVQRFLIHLAGWDERQEGLRTDRDVMAVLTQPRGALAAAAEIVEDQGGAAYV